MTSISALVQAAQTRPESDPAARPDLGSMLMHKAEDSPYLPIDTWTIRLPQWDPIEIAGFAINFSPTKHLVFVLASAVICLLLFTAVARATRRRGHNAPSGLANAIEAMVLYFRNEVVRPNIGHGADAFTPYILTLFFFILFMNLLGLLPVIGSSASGNLSVTAALAVLSLILIEISGFRELGPGGYAKTIFYAPPGMNPVARALMMVIMTPVEFIGKLTKPFALAIRLFANMTAGTILVYSTIGLIFIFADMTLGRWGIAGASVTMASAIMILKVFVSFLQAYIFAMLTAVFIGLIRHAH